MLGLGLVDSCATEISNYPTLTHPLICPKFTSPRARFYQWQIHRLLLATCSLLGLILLVVLCRIAERLWCAS